MPDEPIDGVKFSEFPSYIPGSSDELVGLHNGNNARFSVSNFILSIRQGLSNLFVPQSRTINGKGLSSDISLTAQDVGARSNTWTPSAADVGAQPTITASGILKGDGQGGVSAATAGTDYQAPLTAGTDYATPAQLDGKANQAQLATVESGSTASRAYAVGEYFCWNGLLYRVISPISSGQSFNPGSNCEQVTVGAELASINSKTRSIFASASQTVTITMSGIAAVIMSVSGSNEARTGFYILQSSSEVAAGKFASVIKAASSITLTATSNGWTITTGTGGRTFSFIVMQGEITGLTAS